MNKYRGFTIIELLIALSLSTFIIMGMMQGQRNVMRFVDSTRQMMLINRKVCLLFNQIERDLNSAFIPKLHPKIKGAKKSDDDEKGDDKEERALPTSEEKKQKEEEKKSTREKNKIFFLSQFYEDLSTRINKEKYELLKDISWVCTNPLQVYGQKMMRMVRVGYQLVKDKKASQGEKIVYKLYRKETFDLKNVEFKEPERDDRTKALVKKHLVADNLKGFYIKLEIPEEKKKREGETSSMTPQEEKILSTFEWGKEKWSFGVVPQAGTVHIIFWDEDLKNEFAFNCYIPVLSYPTRYQAKEKIKKDKDVQSDGEQKSPEADRSEKKPKGKRR